MNKYLVVLMMTLAAVSVQAMSIAEARGKIDAVIANPSEMTTIMKALAKNSGTAAADQLAMVAAVNQALAKMPGSAEEKSALAVNVNRAALRGSAKGNTSAILAETFATAPVESLTVLNEIYAKDVLNRGADPKKSYTDERFSAIANQVVTKVIERLAGIDDASVRAGFAIIMMVRASNGSPATLSDTLADLLGKDAQVAKTDWFPAALGPDKNYDPMLAATDAEKSPDVRVAIMMTGPQRHEVILSSLISGDVAGFEQVTDGFGDWSLVPTTDQGVYTVPRTTKNLPWNPDVPSGYDGQTF